MTASLFVAAAAATCLDFVAWLLLIQAGHLVAEGNPLVASMTTQGAAGARLAVVVLLGALAVLADRLRHLTIVVRLALGRGDRHRPDRRRLHDRGDPMRTLRHHLSRRRAYSPRRHALVSRPAPRPTAGPDLAVDLGSDASRDEGRPSIEAPDLDNGAQTDIADPDSPLRVSPSVARAEWSEPELREAFGR